MVIKKVINVVLKFFTEVLDKPGKIIGVIKKPDGWEVKIEVPEEVEYMRKRAQDDLMAIYGVVVDSNIEVVSFDRIALRERDSLTCSPADKFTDDEN
ncbi:MAG TPA: gas vesicle protein GvpO [Bacillota bacterium]|nr:gas vesicle protein GvpO [Bacillota bacterium]